MGVKDILLINSAYIAGGSYANQNLKSRGSFVIGFATLCGEAKTALAKTLQIIKTGVVAQDCYFGVHCDIRNGEGQYSKETIIPARSAVIIKEVTW